MRERRLGISCSERVDPAIVVVPVPDGQSGPGVNPVAMLRGIDRLVRIKLRSGLSHDGEAVMTEQLLSPTIGQYRL